MEAIMKHAVRTISQVFVLLCMVAFSFTSPVFADHSWGTYHWARTMNPFTLSLGDNLNAQWDAHLQTASFDWSVSSILDTRIVSGGTRPKTCKATSGKIEVCNERYGKNGWLGIAQIWTTGSHITQAVAKMNDTYFSTPSYNTSAWRQLVMCQEIAHGFGLDHQDENFSNANLGTCMDYTNAPADNQHPNSHDFEQLELIYAHVDAFTSINQTTPQLAQFLARTSTDEGGNEPRDWGKQTRNSKQSAVYEKDLGNDRKIITHVFWADETDHDH
jgi:hypothetical protein